MKVPVIALLTLTLSADQATAFQPGRLLHQSSRLNSSPFVQIAQMFSTDKPVSNVAIEEASGPGCVRKVGFDEENGQVTFCNQAAVHEGLEKFDFDKDVVKVTYRNQSSLHKALGIKAEPTVTKSSTPPTPTAVATSEPKRTEPTAPASNTEAPVSKSPNQRVYGVVNTKKLNKLYDLIVIGGGPAGVAGVSCCCAF